MDMTLVFPHGIVVPAEDKPLVIERLGAVLTRLGMGAVTTRATARIPIVQFSDPLNGLECDISLQNQLAVANTRLLRTYGAADPRVRSLAFLVKSWAKKRHLNSPSDGTLSSYGFILLLLHFLQNRPTPLLPLLQSLPPDWRGEGPPPGTQLEALQEMRQRCPEVPVLSPDSVRCDAYFFSPSTVQPHVLKDFAAHNTETLGQLLLSFFRYYAWNFDFKRDVVSVRQGAVGKVSKAEQDAWLTSDTLSVEDPFETHYDVAHVVKAAQMAYMRRELLRGYTLASRIFSPGAGGGVDGAGEELPAAVSPEEFFGLLCASTEPPAFTASYKEKDNAERERQEGVREQEKEALTQTQSLPADLLVAAQAAAPEP
ncbi:hypothetical protein B484DRAFT_127925 [Ochromonadaceae sp. CCMP2298]|nr:hypothetical protein B484DRAFT_127925 [Ochromonadaceae sp. CCMP2298]